MQNNKRSPLTFLFAVIGVLAVVGGLGWAGYRRWVFSQQQQGMRVISDTMCAKFAVNMVVGLKPSMEMLKSIGKPSGGTHVITTQQLDDEILKTFAGRNFDSQPLGASDTDFEKIGSFAQKFRNSAPEVAAQCQAFGDSMERCLAPFPYWTQEPSVECREKQIGPASAVLSKFFQRNIEASKD